MKDNAKPSYLGIMNAIAIGERFGFEFLDAWARTTNDTELAHSLQLVAIREAEHAAAFTKRICELGFNLIEKDNPEFSRIMDAVTSDISDQEKFEAVGLGTSPDDGEDRLLPILADKSIDPQTAGLIGRYIAEERDSGRLLYREYRRIAHGQQSDAAAPTLAELGEQIAELRAAVAELQAPKPSRTRTKPKARAKSKK